MTREFHDCTFEEWDDFIARRSRRGRVHRRPSDAADSIGIGVRHGNLRDKSLEKERHEKPLLHTVPNAAGEGMSMIALIFPFIFFAHPYIWAAKAGARSCWEDVRCIKNR